LVTREHVNSLATVCFATITLSVLAIAASTKLVVKMAITVKNKKDNNATIIKNAKAIVVFSMAMSVDAHPTVVVMAANNKENSAPVIKNVRATAVLMQVGLIDVAQVDYSRNTLISQKGMKVILV